MTAPRLILASALLTSGLLAASPLLQQEASQQDADLAVSFAEEHHPALAALLKRLKTNSPAEYWRAIADVERSRARLDRIKSRSDKKYVEELDRWKLNSRTQVLTARLAVLRHRARTLRESDAAPRDVEAALAKAEEQLLKLADIRVDHNLERIARERAELTARLDRLKKAEDTLREDMTAAKDREHRRLLKAVESAARRLKRTPLEENAGGQNDRAGRPNKD